MYLNNMSLYFVIFCVNDGTSRFFGFKSKWKNEYIFKLHFRGSKCENFFFKFSYSFSDALDLDLNNVLKCLTNIFLFFNSIFQVNKFR